MLAIAKNLKELSEAEGANEEYNSFVKELFDVTNEMLATLESTASAAAAALEPELGDTVSKLRDIMEEMPALPDINLQTQLRNLSQLPVGDQYNNLLNSITDNFGTALSAGGFSLSKLVSDAASAVADGKTLTDKIPNMGLPALGGDVIRKAPNVLHPFKNGAAEIPSSYTPNAALSTLQETLSKAFDAAAAAAKSATKTLPNGTKVTTNISGGARSVTVEV